MAVTIDSISPASAPTQGGTVLTIMGSDFGSATGNVTLGGLSCVVQTWGTSEITCLTPAGQGTNLAVVVRIPGGPTSQGFAFSYSKPGITGMSPSTVSTAGGTVLTIHGSSFGTSGTVKIGGVNCSVQSWAHTQIECVAPVGQGTSVPVVVAWEGQESAPAPLSYSPPSITGISPSSAATVGGTILTITGGNFGISGTVRLGGGDCTVSNWTHTTIVCFAPEGQGTNLPVTVTVAGQVSSPKLFGYTAPSITGINPTAAATLGGTVLTITGNNFGLNGIVRLGTSTCTVSNWSHTAIICLAPAGQGTNLPVVVSVAGQDSASATSGYLPPAITGISPASAATAGGTTLTINGNNFGLSGFVRFGSEVLQVTSWSHGQILCTAPAGQGTNLQVVVSVAGRDSAPVAFSYTRPTISNMSPAVGATIGGTPLTITGNNFGLTGTVRFGSAYCPVTSWSHTNIVCTTPAGQGTNVSVVVAAGGQESLTTSYNYSPPTISNISPAVASTIGGTPLTITGNNFGLSGTVRLGLTDCPIVSWGHLEIVCNAPAGQGTNLAMVVSVGGQESQASTFSYSPPSITGINPTKVPTAGGTALTISGNSFGLSGVVTVGGSVCPVTSWEHTQIICNAPEGQGTNLMVVVRVGNQNSSPTSMSYLAPSITGISPTAAGTIGGTPLTITGNNFGLNGVVRVGTTECPVSSWSHTNIVFAAPTGQGTNVAVVVSVAGQEAGPTTFSYSPPSITGIAPGSAATIGGTTLTIMGGNFGLSGKVSMGGAECVVSSWGHTEIVFAAPAGQGTNIPVVVTVAGQGSAPKMVSYSPPSITDVNPTSASTTGGTPLTIHGSDFGISGQVRLGTAACPVSSWSHTQIICDAPAGQGTNLSIVVMVAGQESAPISFGYSPPTITQINPTAAATIGGTPLTITGNNFGSSGTVRLGTVQCSVSSWNDIRIICDAPAGQGTNLAMVVSVGGQDSPPKFFSYSPPSITDISPTAVTTIGGTPLTINGNNFGLSGSVRLGSAICPVSNWSHTNIVCTSPAGQGANLPLVVSVAGQASSPMSFGYLPPSITGISPSSGPTSGGTVLTIIGGNFGVSGRVMVANGECTTLTYEQERITCTTPPGTGANLQVLVTVAGQVSNPSFFSYVTPQISIVNSNGVALLSWPVSAGDYLLEEASVLDIKPNTWTPASLPLVTNGENINVTLTNSTGSKFFRLRK